jgi:hypothetical protein
MLTNYSMSRIQAALQTFTLDTGDGRQMSDDSQAAGTGLMSLFLECLGLADADNERVMESRFEFTDAREQAAFHARGADRGQNADWAAPESSGKPSEFDVEQKT